MMSDRLARISENTVPAETADTVPLTIFAVPKFFQGHAALIQRNAIRSWAALAPHVEIILFGDKLDQGLVQIADEVSASLYDCEVNKAGTPVLNHIFEKTHSVARGRCLCYLNADIILGPEIFEVTDRLKEAELTSFLAIGQRTELNIDSEICFENLDVVRQLNQRRLAEGRLDSAVCKDFFLFTRDLFQDLPPFLVGRGNWDNWMVASSKSAGVPVVDVTSVMSVIHQQHDHQHVPGGRKNAYVFGEEARENQRLAGGRHLLRGSHANWYLTGDGLKNRTFPLFSIIRDIPKFGSLLSRLARS